ncbi:MAG: hypothetical protein ACTSUO_02885 [Candidatus Thorarchaeota archaeon]
MAWRGRRGGSGRSRGRWPGNGPFRDLPPWERPGWLYGPGSCWSLGYRQNVVGTPITPPVGTNIESLSLQRTQIENQLKDLQEALVEINKRLKELEK